MTIDVSPDLELELPELILKNFVLFYVTKACWPMLLSGFEVANNQFPVAAGALNQFSVAPGGRVTNFL